MKRVELGSPIRANMEITEVCPLSCKHCYTYWGYAATGVKQVASLETNDCKHYLRILDKLINNGIHVLTITGGEPFVKKEILYTVARKAKEAGMVVFINTCAVLIAQEDIEIIKRLRIDGFLVSLMSYDEATNNDLSQTDSYRHTVEGIKLLAQNGQNVSVNMVCSKRNYKDIKKTAELVWQLGAKSFSAAPMMAALSYPQYLEMRLSNEELKEVFEELLWVKNNIPIISTTLESLPYCAFTTEEILKYRELLSHSYCGAGLCDCAISIWGDVRPCIMSNRIIGNILSEDWSTIWNHLEKWRSIELLPQECQNCSVVGECGGGCRVSANTTGGSFSSKDPYMTHALNTQLGNNREEVFLNDIKLHSKLKMATGVTFRSEPFGGTIFHGNKCMFLKENPYALFCSLNNVSQFTPYQVMNTYRCEKEELFNFLCVLTDEGFFTKLDDYNRDEGGKCI